MLDSINLKIKGINTKVNVIRYFLSQEQRYLIYTLSEKDETGYIKLYVSKIDYNPLRAISINDEDEWNRIKDLIKTTIKENKASAALSIIDLNYADIENIEVVDSKIFKLLDSMVEILSSNKKLFEDFSDAFIEKEEEKPSKKVIEDEYNYKDLYFQEIENRKIVEEDLKKALKVIDKFREKVDQINELFS